MAPPGANTRRPFSPEWRALTMPTTGHGSLLRRAKEQAPPAQTIGIRRDGTPTKRLDANRTIKKSADNRALLVFLASLLSGPLPATEQALYRCDRLVSGGGGAGRGGSRAGRSHGSSGSRSHRSGRSRSHGGGGSRRRRSGRSSSRSGGRGRISRCRRRIVALAASAQRQDGSQRGGADQGAGHLHTNISRF